MCRCAGSLVERYRDCIGQTLQKYPALTASRLFDRVCERGYAGQRSHFRHPVSTQRPPAEAYLRLRSLPGEQMQADGGHFGHLQIGQARCPLQSLHTPLPTGAGQKRCLTGK